MDPNWTDIVTALTAAGAVVLAAGAWFTSMNSLRTSYRPVIRVVPLLVGGGMGSLVLPHRALLKNIGFGPALCVLLYEDPTARDAEPLAAFPLVERLTDDQIAEKERRGRVELTWNSTRAGRYRVVYQDIAGAWHETKFRVLETALMVQMLGPRRWYHVVSSARRIPASALTVAQVVRAHEGV